MHIIAEVEVIEKSLLKKSDVTLLTFIRAVADTRGVTLEENR